MAISHSGDSLLKSFSFPPYEKGGNVNFALKCRFQNTELESLHEELKARSSLILTFNRCYVFVP